MAEIATTGPAETGAEMDYGEHDRTFAGFVNFTKLGIVVCINIMVALIIFAFGSAGSSFLLGVVLTIMLLIAGAIGLAMNASWKPSAVVLALGLVFFVLTVV